MVLEVTKDPRNSSRLPIGCSLRFFLLIDYRGHSVKTKEPAIWSEIDGSGEQLSGWIVWVGTTYIWK